MANDIVDLDRDLFNGIIADLDSYKDDIASIKGIISSGFACLSGDLAGEVSSGIVDSSLSTIGNDFGVISNAIASAISQYDATEAGNVFDMSMFEEGVGATFTQIEATIVEGTNLSLEERLDMLRNTITAWEAIKKDLESEFEKKYGKGIQYANPQQVRYMLGLLSVLDIPRLIGAAGTKTSAMLGALNDNYLDLEYTCRAMEAIEKYDLLNRFDKYLNGASWEECGFDKIYGPASEEENSMLFRMYIACHDFDINIYAPSKNEVDRDFIVDKFTEMYRINSVIDPLNDPYRLIEALKEQTAEAIELQTNINSISTQVYQLKQFEKLLPYTHVVENPDFSSYSNRDYLNDKSISDYLKENLSQEELAVYVYIIDHDGKAKADQYLEAMQDLINQRIGMRRAVSYMETLNENGLDVLDYFYSSGVGFIDGTRNFFDGFKDLFTSDGVISPFEYEMMYKIGILANSNKYNNKLSAAEREFLKFNYQSWQSIGNMWIPAAISFIPVLGKPVAAALSSITFGLSIAGNSIEDAKQSGVFGWRAYLYGLASGLSEVAFERILGGIPGLSNLGESFLKNCAKEGVEEFLQEWIGAGLRCALLGESIDVTETMGNSLYAMLQGMVVSGMMQGGQKLAFKIGDSIVYWGDSEYNSLSEMLAGISATADGKIISSEIMTKILEMDNNSAIKKNILSVILNNVAITDPHFLSQLDSKTMGLLFDYCVETNNILVAESILDYSAGKGGISIEQLASLFTAYRENPDLMNMSETELERYMNEITSGQFSETLDRWQQAVYEFNLSNAYWDARIDLIKNIIAGYGLTGILEPKTFMQREGIDYYRLAQEIQKRVARTQTAYDVAQEIEQYIIDNPIKIDSSTLYIRSIEECIRAEEILMERVRRGEIKDIAKAVEYMVIDKAELRRVYGITEKSTSAEIKASELYRLYLEEVLDEARYEAVLHEMVPNGTSGRVFNVQTTGVFEGYTLGKGSLGRVEGYYVISEAKLIASLTRATGRTITSADVDNILQGNSSSYNIDMAILEQELGFPQGYLSSEGAYLVQSTATPESLRASIPTDEGANAYYIPGMQTAGGSNEMLNEQQTGLEFQQTSPNSYADPNNGVSAGKL